MRDVGLCLHYSTVQHRTVKYSRVEHSTVQYSTVQGQHLEWDGGTVSTVHNVGVIMVMIPAPATLTITIMFTL